MPKGHALQEVFRSLNHVKVTYVRIPIRIAIIFVFLSQLIIGSMVNARPDDPHQLQQQQLAMLRAQDERVARIGWRLATANRALCPVTFSATGITLHTLSQYDRRWRKAAASQFGLGEIYPGILAVVPASPAWIAGLRPDDAIVSIGGADLAALATPRADRRASYAASDSAMRLLEDAPPGQPLEIVALRGTDRVSLVVVPVASCASRFEIKPSAQANANANGRVVQVFGELVTRLDRDEDLALVMAHEMAHNTLGHEAAIKERRLATGLAAGLGGSGRILRGFEREADRLGLYLAARADFSIAEAPGLWSRAGIGAGLSAWIAATHPAPDDRSRAAEATVAEIARLTKEGRDLVPEGFAGQVSPGPAAD